jgi:orotidine-5'-phosphate decarboxylase
LGREAIQPFLDRLDKGAIILCRTSNSGAGEFQDLMTNGQPLYQQVASAVTKEWNSNQNCALVVGATYPKELKQIRKLAPDLPLLIPGIGAQGGDLEATLAAGLDKHGSGIIINAARSIIFVSTQANFAQQARVAAEKLVTQINKFRFGAYDR